MGARGGAAQQSCLIPEAQRDGKPPVGLVPLQGTGATNATLTGSTTPLRVAGSDNISRVVAGWETSFGLQGNGTLETLPPGYGGPAGAPPSLHIVGEAAVSSPASFAVGAIVGIVAAVAGKCCRLSGVPGQRGQLPQLRRGALLDD